MWFQCGVWGKLGDRRWDLSGIAQAPKCTLRGGSSGTVFRGALQDFLNNGRCFLLRCVSMSSYEDDACLTGITVVGAQAKRVQEPGGVYPGRQV